MGLKTVTLHGRLVRDPEVRTSKGGTDICNFTVAVDSNRPPRDGQKSPSSFFKCVAFGKQGQNVAKFMQKGDEISVVGDIELDTYQAQDGQTHSNMSVTVSSSHFGRKSQSQSSSAGNAHQSAPQQRAEFEEASLY